MKILIPFIAAASACTSAFAQQSNLEKSDAYLKQGVLAEKTGDPDAALASYQAALKLNPKNVDARFRAGQVKIHAASIRSSATEAKIGAVLLPVYQLDEATVREALELLSLNMDKQTGGEIVPNFVIEDPKNRLAENRMSMQLKNVPVKAVLDYILTQTNTKVRFDEYAVVIVAR